MYPRQADGRLGDLGQSARNTIRDGKLSQNTVETRLSTLIRAAEKGPDLDPLYTHLRPLAAQLSEINWPVLLAFAMVLSAEWYFRKRRGLV